MLLSSLLTKHMRPATALFSTVLRATRTSSQLARKMSTEVPKYTYLAVIPDLADSKR